MPAVPPASLTAFLSTRHTFGPGRQWPRHFGGRLAEEGGPGRAVETHAASLPPSVCPQRPDLWFLRRAGTPQQALGPARMRGPLCILGASLPPEQTSGSRLCWKGTASLPGPFGVTWEESGDHRRASAARHRTKGGRRGRRGRVKSRAGHAFEGGPRGDPSVLAQMDTCSPGHAGRAVAGPSGNRKSGYP